QPVVRVFVKANPTPVAVIPLAPDAVTIGAPCQMLYVADVIWPQRQDGGIDAGAVRVIAQGADDAGLIAYPLIRRYGTRGNTTDCSPNITKNGNAQWYAPAP